MIIKKEDEINNLKNLVDSKLRNESKVLEERSN
jgi:hypothetical protein